MANMCSVDFYLEFKNKTKALTAINSFKSEIEKAKDLHEGVQISEDTWLFDASVEEENNQVIIRGWVRWILSQDAMQEFIEKLKRQGLKSLECIYEETGNCIYGKYQFQNNELWDIYIPEEHDIWQKNYEDEEFFELLEKALNNDGESVMVA